MGTVARRQRWPKTRSGRRLPRDAVGEALRPQVLGCCSWRPAERRQGHELIFRVATRSPRGRVRIDDLARGAVKDERFVDVAEHERLDRRARRDLGCRGCLLWRVELHRAESLLRRPRCLANETDDLLGEQEGDHDEHQAHTGLGAPRERETDRDHQADRPDRSDDPRVQRTRRHVSPLVPDFRAQHWPSVCDARPLPSSASAVHPLGGAVLPIR